MQQIADKNKHMNTIIKKSDGTIVTNYKSLSGNEICELDLYALDVVDNSDATYKYIIRSYNCGIQLMCKEKIEIGQHINVKAEFLYAEITNDVVYYYFMRLYNK